MNLWVKRTGQLFIAVLFLMSCEDDSFLLGYKNQNKRFNLRYQELSLESSSMLIDSAITDNTIAPVRLLIGRYNDNVFGEVRSEGYTNFYPATDTLLDTDNAVMDSLVIYLRLDNYVYGADGKTNETLSLHRIIEDFNPDIFNDSLNINYYSNSSIAYDVSPIATASAQIHYDSLTKSNASQDTVLFKFKIDNTSPFANEVFNFIKNNNTLDDSTYYTKFREVFKGLAIVPASTNNKVLGFSHTDGLSRLTFSYHTPSVDSMVHTLIFGSLNFSRVTTDRSMSDLSGLASYQSFDLTDSRFVQAGSPVVTKLDLSNFYSFTDTIPNIQINSAELVITPNGVVDGLEPPSLIVQLQHANNQFLNLRVQADRDMLTGYTQLDRNAWYYAAGSDLNIGTLVSPVILSYSRSQNKYSGFLTLFVQDLFNNKTKEDKISYISLVPHP
ncbi:MAG TPA: hypothetical protein VGK47_03555, partial [Nitrososphaeraceae archaeon]